MVMLSLPKHLAELLFLFERSAAVIVPAGMKTVSAQPRRAFQLARRTVLVVAGAAILAGAAITAWWFARLTSAEVLRHTLGPAVAVFSVTALLMLVNVCLRWVRWHFLSRRAGLPLETRESALVYLTTLPAILTPFFVGELLRAVLLGRKYPHYRAHVAVIWLIERSTDLLVVSAFAVLAGRHWLLLMVAVAVWAAIVLGVRSVFAERKLRSTLNPAMLTLLIGGSAFAWLLPVLALWRTGPWLGAQANFMTCLDAFAFGTTFGSLFGLPAGTGVAGSSMIGIFHASGVAEDVAILSVFLFRAATTWFAVGLGVAVALAFRRPLLSLARDERARPNHFDDIADDYAEEIPEHVRRRLLQRKADMMRHWLRLAGVPDTSRGLDFGCGQGWYLSAMAEAGYGMCGVDTSRGQIEHAQALAARAGVSVELAPIEGEHLPYDSDSFDFVYAINVLHHVPNESSRSAVLQEILRVLKPGGVFFMHEINVANPLFRFYMGYIFPLIRAIDEGTEKWIPPAALPDAPGGRWEPRVEYFTFLPDFLPRGLVKLFLPLERRLETSRLRHWSAHYMARLVKDGEPPEAAH